MIGVLAFYSDDPCSNSDEFFLQNCLKITKEAGADPLKHLRVGTCLYMGTMV